MKSGSIVVRGALTGAGIPLRAGQRLVASLSEKTLVVNEIASEQPQIEPPPAPPSRWRRATRRRARSRRAARRERAVVPPPPAPEPPRGPPLSSLAPPPFEPAPLPPPRQQPPSPVPETAGAAAGLRPESGRGGVHRQAPAADPLRSRRRGLPRAVDRHVGRVQQPGRRPHALVVRRRLAALRRFVRHHRAARPGRGVVPVRRGGHLPAPPRRSARPHGDPALHGARPVRSRVHGAHPRGPGGPAHRQQLHAAPDHR